MVHVHTVGSRYAALKTSHILCLTWQPDHVIKFACLSSVLAAAPWPLPGWRQCPLCRPSGTSPAPAPAPAPAGEIESVTVGQRSGELAQAQHTRINKQRGVWLVTGTAAHNQGEQGIILFAFVNYTCQMHFAKTISSAAFLLATILFKTISRGSEAPPQLGVITSVMMMSIYPNSCPHFCGVPDHCKECVYD